MEGCLAQPRYRKEGLGPASNDETFCYLPMGNLTLSEGYREFGGMERKKEMGLLCKIKKKLFLKNLLVHVLLRDFMAEKRPMTMATLIKGNFLLGNLIIVQEFRALLSWWEARQYASIHDAGEVDVYILQQSRSGLRHWAVS